MDQMASSRAEACSFKIQDTTTFFSFKIKISFDFVPQAKDDNEIFIQEQSFGSRSTDNYSSCES